MIKTYPVYVRNLVFGVEDGLVSTVGFLAGVSAGGIDKDSIILGGIVLIFVEAFSMGVGSFLSESSTEEFEGEKKMVAFRSVSGGIIMFFSYVFAGFLVLLPFLIFDGLKSTIYSVCLALVALAVLGLVGARLARVSLIKRVLRMIIFGGFAITIGIIVGILIG